LALPAAAAPAATDTRVDQLERLARLRDSGALDEQEFRTEKARILGHTSAM
jgi:Short C-terminal domain